MKQERQNLFAVITASLIAGCCAFLFVFIIELMTTHWVSRKFHQTKLLYFLGVYVTLGVAYGIGAAALHRLILKSAGKRFELRPAPLFAALGISAFPCFFAFIILNTQYMPHSPIFSGQVILLNLMLACLFLGLLVFLYKVITLPGTAIPAFMLTGVCCSMAGVLAIFNAFASRQVGKDGLAFLLAAGFTFFMVLTGALVAAVDVKVTGLLARRGKENGREVYFKWLFFAKIFVVTIAFAAILLGRRYRPLVSESGVTQPSEVVAGRPNIIIIMLDTVRQDRLSAYGCERETSPNIARLAEQSYVFDAYSTASWTLPAHASIVTGLYPTENGTGAERNYQIDPRNETLAEILRENGYATAAVISNHLILNHFSGFAQGFDYYYSNPRETDPAFTTVASCLLEKFLPDSPELVVLPFKRAETINEMAIRWIEKKDGRPFFLFLNYMDSHIPYVPPLPYARRWLRKAAPERFFGRTGIWPEFSRAVNEGKRKMNEAEREYLLSQYDGEIAYLDSHIGVFLRELSEIGVYDNSLIILTSDHGESFNEHGLVEHQRVLYQELIRIPLIIKPPADKKGKPGRINGAVSIIDLFHSILENVGIPHDSKAGGKNILEGESSPIFSETHSLSGESGPEFLKRFGTDIYTLIQDNHKLIYSSKQTYELYDLLEDPSETRNLAAGSLGPDDEIALARMKTQLDFWMNQIAARELKPKALPAETRDQVHSRLKALGYIQ